MEKLNNEQHVSKRVDTTELAYHVKTMFTFKYWKRIVWSTWELPSNAGWETEATWRVSNAN